MQINDEQDRAIAKALWQDALSSEWTRPLVWVHGDFAVGNILVQHGKLKAVIDFGQLATGDPACDLVITHQQAGGFPVKSEKNHNSTKCNHSFSVNRKPTSWSFFLY